MNSNLPWIFLLIIQLQYVTSRPLEENTADHDTGQEHPYRADNSYNEGSSKANNDDQVISVRITSSIAVGRGKGKSTQITSENNEPRNEFTSEPEPYENGENEPEQIPNASRNLEGANIEFIKQLNAKKKLKDTNADRVYPFQLSLYQRNNESDYNNERNETSEYDKGEQNDGNTSDDNMPSSSQDVNHFRGIGKFESSILKEALKYSNERLIFNATDDLLANVESKKVSEISTSSTTDNDHLNTETYNETDDSIAESSVKSVLEIAEDNESYENIENVPLARSVLQSPSSKNFIQGLANKPPSERESSTRVTTVSFNIVHDSPRMQSNTFSDPAKYVNPSQTFEQNKFYDPPKIYSQPAQIYSEPAKIYSEPSKIYSEPARIYSEPAKIYSEPAKIYSEPAKFYSEPASLHLNPNAPPNYTPWQQPSQPPSSTTSFSTTPNTAITNSDSRNTPRIPEHQAERNYEVDEKESVMSDGRSHGVQESTTEKCKQDNCKVGYVVKGRQYNKYRVEERTSDGFIVGEYGVVRNEDGALRGVRYTADSEASPRLIYDALMKFLQLK